MSEYNPLFMDALNSSGLTASDSWGFQPIQRFGTYEFTDPKQAAEFMGSRNFTDFWGRGSVDPSDVATRVEYQTRGRYANPVLQETAADEIARANASLQRRLAPNSLVSREDAINAYNFSTTGTRAEGRFYTPVEEKNALNFYLKKAGLQEGGSPVRVIADERVSRSSLKGGEKFGGWTSETGGNVHEAGMGTEGKKRNLSRVGGRNLGLALSSNPEQEVFVPSNMARPASQGGSSRVAGRVLEGGNVVLKGMPKTSVPMQYLGNINRVGGKIGTGLLAPVGIGMQVYGATRDNMYDREYGYSDPFALRPVYDLALSGIGNNQTPAQALNAMERQVADPEWQMRNPLAATAYNLAFGNTEPAKAFAEGYRPFFSSAPTARYDIVPPK